MQTAPALSASDLITNERKIETKVLAKDGDIVVLGGLVKDDIQDAQHAAHLGYRLLQDRLRQRCHRLLLTLWFQFYARW